MPVKFVSKASNQGLAPKPTPEKKSGVSFLKKGKAAHSAFQEEEAKAEMAREQAGKLWRFYCKPDETATITFLDGELDDEGLLDIPMFREHRLQIAGKWDEFVCTDDNEPCPICQRGDNKPTLVGVMTILDHRPYEIKSGPNAGNTIQHRPKLFVAKRQTIKQLTKIAQKRGGLTGCTFEVTRTADKSPAVGDMLDFVEKNTLQDLQDEFGKFQPEGHTVAPADYEKEIVYRTAAELIELGVGVKVTSVGGEKGPSQQELADQL